MKKDLRALIEESENLTSDEKEKVRELLNDNTENMDMLYKNYLAKKQNKNNVEVWERIVRDEIRMLMEDGKFSLKR